MASVDKKDQPHHAQHVTIHTSANEEQETKTNQSPIKSVSPTSPTEIELTVPGGPVAPVIKSKSVGDPSKGVVSSSSSGGGRTLCASQKEVKMNTKKAQSAAKSTRSPHHKGPKTPEVPKSMCQHIRDIFISLRFAFMFMVISSLVIVSVLSWSFTFQAAQNSIGLVTGDYSNVLISQIAADVDRRLVAAEHITMMNKNYFASGLLSWNDPTTMLHTFFLQSRTYVVDTVSSVTMTTAAGEMNGIGWLYPEGAAPMMVQWTTFGDHFTEQHIDPLTYAKLEITSEAVTGGASTDVAWYQCVNTSNINSIGWTQPYLWNADWFISSSRTLLNSTGDLLGVATVDMSLGFTDNMAKQLASASNVGAEFYIVDSASGNLLGTSIPGFSLKNETDPNNVQAVYLYSSTSTSMMHALHEWILSQSGQTDESDPTTVYSDLPQMSGQMSVDGRRFLVSVKPFVHGAEANPDHSIKWLFIHVLDRSTIESEIAASNTKVLISVCCICGGFIIATSLLLWYSMRLINQLSVVLTSFARFEFSDHVAGGKLKSRSIFTELKEMQSAVLEMTRSFKKHLDMKHAVFGKPISASSSSGSPSTSGSSGVTTTPNQLSRPGNVSYSGPHQPLPMPLTTRPKSFGSSNKIQSPLPPPQPSPTSLGNANGSVASMEGMRGPTPSPPLVPVVSPDALTSPSMTPPPIVTPSPSI